MAPQFSECRPGPSLGSQWVPCGSGGSFAVADESESTNIASALGPCGYTLDLDLHLDMWTPRICDQKRLDDYIMVALLLWPKTHVRLALLGPDGLDHADHRPFEPEFHGGSTQLHRCVGHFLGHLHMASDLCKTSPDISQSRTGHRRPFSCSVGHGSAGVACFWDLSNSFSTFQLDCRANHGPDNDGPFFVLRVPMDSRNPHERVG